VSAGPSLDVVSRIHKDGGRKWALTPTHIRYQILAEYKGASLPASHAIAGSGDGAVFTAFPAAVRSRCWALLRWLRATAAMWIDLRPSSQVMASS
jgi:hypothetical protein